MKKRKKGKNMETHSLINDARKYQGKYVATKSFQDKVVISSGNDPVQVIKQAKKKGAKDPFLVYISEPGVAQAY